MCRRLVQIFSLLARFCRERSHSVPLQIIMLARFATLGHRSAASLATGPRISVPFNSPSGVMMTAALSWNDNLVPSGRLNVFRWRTTTAGNICRLRSGEPFETEIIIMSPTHADGTRLSRVCVPRTWMTLSSLAPVLSAQVSLLPLGSPLAMRGRYSTMPFALTARVFGAGM